MLRNLLAVGLVGLVSTPVLAAWNEGEWHVNPANGHAYSVNQIEGGITGWLIARTQAQALVGPGNTAVDLVTITSAEENAFVFAGIDDAAYWTIDNVGNNEGPNMGGFQPTPNAPFEWVTGEPFVYTSWAPGEPNNSSGIEDYMTYFTQGSGRTSNWNDISAGTGVVGGQGFISYYVAETTAAVPEPTSLAVMAGAAAIVLRRRR